MSTENFQILAIKISRGPGVFARGNLLVLDIKPPVVKEYHLNNAVLAPIYIAVLLFLMICFDYSCNQKTFLSFPYSRLRYVWFNRNQIRQYATKCEIISNSSRSFIG